LDTEQLRQARRSVDIAMYSFTDWQLGRVLADVAARGVTIRIYRDRGQFESEQRNAARFRNGSPAQVLRGVSNVHIRVKQGSERVLMHLKAYAVDGKLLRDGSANWSPSGEKLQDNNARFTADPQEVSAFERTFETLWSRPGNLIVQ
jgi:phosphatidylserine/phosphatidylglycerophosphate/cardiolipin synthase-like enzyme